MVIQQPQQFFKIEPYKVKHEFNAPVWSEDPYNGNTPRRSIALYPTNFVLKVGSLFYALNNNKEWQRINLSQEFIDINPFFFEKKSWGDIS